MKRSCKLAGLLPCCVVAFTLLLAYVPHILSQNVLSHSFLKGDCYYYKAMIVSMLEDGDLVEVTSGHGSLAAEREFFSTVWK